MILVHRLSGEPFHLNSDLIETVEATPDTVVCLVDGRRVIVQERPSTIVERIQIFRASLLVSADEIRESHTRAPLKLVRQPESDNGLRDDDGRVDVMLITGLAVALLAIVGAMLIDGNNLGPLLGGAALVLVAPASIGAALMGFRRDELATVPSSLRRAVTAGPLDLSVTITRLARLAETARRHGMLALERELIDDDDAFIREGVHLLVDGLDEQIIRENLNIAIAATDERHRVPISFLKQLAGYAPTFGMIGTIIGLINMLGSLQDPSQLGAGLALALLTTLYGVLLANLVFHPLATRLERLNQSELSALDMMLDGLLAIHRGATPRVLIERLEAYLPPDQRIGADEHLKRHNPSDDADREEAA